MENGTTWGATECLLSLLKHDPDNADVHRELGRTYATQTNPDQALSHYRKSVEFFLRADRLENASEAFAQMRQYYPTAHVNMKSEFRLARYLADAGNHEVAIPILENIIRLHPESPEAETAVVKIGDIYLNNLDEPQTAQVWYDCFLREYPHSSYRAMVEKSLSRISGNG